MEDFDKYKIKDYKYWQIFIHQNQGYLGRCVVWCKREDALDLTDANEEEQKELFLVLNELREAIKKVFQPDWFNYSFLGNETRHLHAHFVPRYAKPKVFGGITFEDKLWGHNYKTDHSFETPEPVLEKIKLLISEALTKT
jgi:diadenosine tetraphosphate (Ap4A) HIT family hydrolase